MASTRYGTSPPHAGLAVAGIQDVAEIQIQAVPHGSPPCCAGITLSHHRCELTVIDLPVLKTTQRLIGKQTSQDSNKTYMHGTGQSRTKYEETLTLF